MCESGWGEGRFHFLFFLLLGVALIKRVKEKGEFSIGRHIAVDLNGC